MKNLPLSASGLPLRHRRRGRLSNRRVPKGSVYFSERVSEKSWLASFALGFVGAKGKIHPTKRAFKLV